MTSSPRRISIRSISVAEKVAKSNSSRALAGKTAAAVIAAVALASLLPCAAQVRIEVATAPSVIFFRGDTKRSFAIATNTCSS